VGNSVTFPETARGPARGGARIPVGFHRWRRIPETGTGPWRIAMRRGTGSRGIEIAEVMEADTRGIARASAIAMSPTRKPPMALAPFVRKKSDHLNLAITNAVRERGMRGLRYPYRRITGSVTGRPPWLRSSPIGAVAGP